MSATIALHDSDDPFAKCIPATIAMLELFIVSLFCVSIHIDMYASEDRFPPLVHACMNAHVAFCPLIGRGTIDHIGESIHALPPNGGQRRNVWLIARGSYPDRSYPMEY